MPISVKQSDADRNRTANTTAWTRNARLDEEAKLSLGNLHPNITEKQIRAIFSPFGKIVRIRIERDQVTGASKEFGFIIFKSLDPSRREMEALNGFNIGGRALKVQLSAIGLDKTKVEKDVLDLTASGQHLGTGPAVGVRFRARPQGIGIHAAGQGWDEWITGGVKKEEVKEEDKQFIDKRGMIIKKGVRAGMDVFDRDETERGGLMGMSKTEKVRLMAKLADGTDMELPRGAQEVLDRANQLTEEAKKKAAQTQDDDTPCKYCYFLVIVCRRIL